MQDRYNARMQEVGLTEPWYRFLFGPEGFRLSDADAAELAVIGKASAAFVADADAWYVQQHSGSHWASLLNRGIPAAYLPLARNGGLPHTFMVDTVWTAEGWRIVELDVTNRNGLGYPLVLRYLYDLPSVFKGTVAEWRERGWGVNGVQIMATHCRFYAPYYRFFLAAAGGRLIAEEELAARMGEVRAADMLLDLPVFSRGDFLPELLDLAGRLPFGIPPKHHLSSKALPTLAFGEKHFPANGIAHFLPETRLLRKSTPVPEAFFVKLFQSGGAHGTFHNNQRELERLRSKRPRAVLQNAWPIVKRPIMFLDGDQALTMDKFIRLSLYLNSAGEIVDADVTGSDEPIVHGGVRTVMTVAVR